MRILVADDDPETWHLVSNILGNAGHATLWARDAMQAVQLAQRQRPELVLLDIRMPAGSGIGALLKLKASSFTRSIPVVVLSGVEDPAVEQEVLRDGAVAFLHKPVDPEALLNALLRLDGHAQA